MYSNICTVRESSQKLVQIVKNKMNVLFDLNKIQSNINDCNEVTNQIIITSFDENFVSMNLYFSEKVENLYNFEKCQIFKGYFCAQFEQ
jgi:hypothetical protein